MKALPQGILGCTVQDLVSVIHVSCRFDVENFFDFSELRVEHMLACSLTHFRRAAVAKSFFLQNFLLYNVNMKIPGVNKCRRSSSLGSRANTTAPVSSVPFFLSTFRLYWRGNLS